MATLGYNLNTGGLITTAVTGMLLTPSVAAGAAVEPVTATVLVTGLVAKGLFDRITVSNYSCENTLKRVERLRSKTLPPDRHYINRRNI